MSKLPACALVFLAVTLCAGRVAAAQVNAGTDSAVTLAVPAPAEGFTVAILGDRTTGVPAGLAVLRQAVDELNLLKPDLVIHIGDLVPGYLRDMDQWERDIAQVQSILAGLKAPLLPLAGNHDVITGTGNVNDHRGEELFKDHFGPLYYSFDYRNVHFICLYTDEALQSAPRLSDAQVRWLREDLDRAKARSIFVFMHKPLWEYPDAGWDAIHQMLKAHPVRAVFAGHFHHYYKSDLRDGIQYYVIGVTGGSVFDTELAGGLTHYCLLHITPDGYTLALVRPGSVLPDDYIRRDDFKAMEAIRFLTPDQTGVEAPVSSPELGPVSGQVAVYVTNPTDRALDVTVRGNARGGSWSFRPESATIRVEPGWRRTVVLGIGSPQVGPLGLVAPQVEVQYTYIDSRGRPVPLVLPRRIPVRRELHAEVTSRRIDIDGSAKEEVWQHAPPLTTARWTASPYETTEAGPTFRVLPADGGLYFYADSPDATVSDFRGEQVLCDAIFIGALEATKGFDASALQHAPVVVVYPFGSQARGQAMRAFWDPKRPVGAEVPGVRVETVVLPDGRGWHCEGFVPWDVLLGAAVRAPETLRFNIGAWDNDGDLFTELHSWEPTAGPSEWGDLVLEPPAAR